LLAETTKAEKIEHLVKPVKDLFGAIFFVSVGMLIDLRMIPEYAGPILLITAVCILGKILTTGFGAFASGNSLKVSLQTGMSLAQIGEFSFIIAALGASLNATSEHLYPIIVAVSGITTFSTPYLIKASGPFYDWIEKKMPEKWRQSLARYSSEANTITAVSDFRQVLTSFVINVVLFSVILAAIIYLSYTYFLPLAISYIGQGFGGVAASVITLMVMAPFLWGLTIRNERNESFAKLYAQQNYKGPILLMRGVRIALSLAFIVFLLNRFFSHSIAIIAAILMITMFFLFRRKIQNLYDKIENRFISNLNDRELQEEIRLLELQAGKRNVALAPWDAHLTTFEVEPEVPIVGKTLGELRWRELIGVNVAMIKRGNITIAPPSGNDYIYPCDKLFVICTDAQEKKMNAILRPDKRVKENGKELEIELDKYILEADSPFINKTIRESGIRITTNGSVVGLEREGQRILNPPSDTVLRAGDTIWIAGVHEKIRKVIQGGELVD
ncbi:MAG TPA: TrkA C-terminal domain-containing protein, partial [Parasegetibacter sp.]